MRPLSGVVAGLGVWTPSAPAIAAWAHGVDVPAQAEPLAAMLGPRLRRRTSLLTRMACEALAQATAAAGSDPGRVVTVFGTAWGEMQTTGALLAMLVQGDGALSPASFHNSVQNAAAGHASIATANHAASTTVSAGPATVAMALLEGLLLAREHDDVAVVVADEPLPAPFAGEELAPLAVALVLRRAGVGRRIELMRQTVGAAPPRHLAPALVRNPVAPALALLEALTGERPAAVPIEWGDGPVWLAQVTS